MFATEFVLTPNNIRVFARATTGRVSVRQGNIFAFEGDDPIDFEDADSMLHFFFPKDYAWAVNDTATNFAGEIGETTAKAVPVLRQQYVDAVTALRSNIPTMREAGMSSEQIARALHAERRVLGEKFKSLTPPDMLQKIYERNLQRYGDRLGPSIEWLLKQGKSWEDIIESATRTGGKDLGF